ncbi:MAG: ABC transporter ATP-binding protein [Myxococcota bacterium]|jgi:ATP-binding cassette subfamily B protein|nr:ABC transporter ATP-binding protein [Myxococcota bacterium]
MSKDKNIKKELNTEEQIRKEQAIGSGFKEQQLGELSDTDLTRRLWHYMRPYKWTFLFCLLLLPFVSAIQLVQPYLLQVAIDDYLIPKKFDGIELLVGAFAASLFGRAFVEFGQLYLMQRAGQRALYDLRVEVFAHVQKLSVSFFHKNPVGRLMTRMTTDVESLQEALSSGMITMVGDIFTLSAIVVLLLVLDWRLALVSFLVVPPLVILTAVFRSFLRRAFRAIRVKIARLNAHLQESVTGMHIIQYFVRERISAREYEEINKDYRLANIKSVRYDAMLYAVVEAAGSITVGAIIWYGSGQVLEGVVTLGVLVAFIEYMQKFFVPIRDLAQKYNLLQSAMASSERIFQLLDTDEYLPEQENPTSIPDGELTIEFDDVWFAYNDEDWILKGIDFTINPGEKIAIVGHTGAGKTTIMNLLLRLHDVNRGQIRVNGVDIRELDLNAWRARFSVVLQDSFLFRGTIGENIQLGALDASREEIEQAAKTVRAHELISRYEKGYEHMVKERGGNLSSGERQLLAFARALVHAPDVLLLDEATANVDTETEALIQEAQEVLMERQTSLVIAHRLSTIRTSNRIMVLHRGELLESGTHEELLEARGHYHKLYRLQYSPDAAA